MDKAMDTEEILHFIMGQLDALKHICCGMAALHPRRSDLMQLGQYVLDNAAQKNASETYKAGIQQILETLQAMGDAALTAELVRRRGPGKERH